MLQIDIVLMGDGHIGRIGLRIAKIPILRDAARAGIDKERDLILVRQ